MKLQDVGDDAEPLNPGGDDAEKVTQANELSDPPGTEPGITPVYSTTAFNPSEHKAKTRRLLALIILIILAILYVLAVGAFILRDINSDQLIGLVAAFSGIQTLAAAAVGFYFAKGDD